MDSKTKVESLYLTKSKNSQILGRGNDMGQAVPTKTLNRLKATPWSINEEILPYISDKLNTIEGLSAIEERNRVDSFLLRTKETDNVINYLLENENKFWFDWKVDFRFRMYSQGYHVNPQGNAYRKAMLVFHDKEELTEEGIQALRYDIANTYGLDKETWDKRNDKALSLIDDIFYTTIANNVYTRSDERIEERMLHYSELADEPELFIKAILAWKKGVINEEPLNHDMYYDATASGIQVLSTLAGCTSGASISNINPCIERTYTPEVATRLAELEAELASL